MYIKRIIISIFICSCFISCVNKENKINVENIVQEWKGKEINFPKDMTYTFQGYNTPQKIQAYLKRLLLFEAIWILSN